MGTQLDVVNLEQVLANQVLHFSIGGADTK
jgi:hypothetical protein